MNDLNTLHVQFFDQETLAEVDRTAIQKVCVSMQEYLKKINVHIVLVIVLDTETKGRPY